jgi:hypothetical protein
MLHCFQGQHRIAAALQFHPTIIGGTLTYMILQNLIIIAEEDCASLMINSSALVMVKSFAISGIFSNAGKQLLLASGLPDGHRLSAASLTEYIMLNTARMPLRL